MREDPELEDHYFREGVLGIYIHVIIIDQVVMQK